MKDYELDEPYTDSKSALSVRNRGRLLPDIFRAFQNCLATQGRPLMPSESQWTQL